MVEYIDLTRFADEVRNRFRKLHAVLRQTQRTNNEALESLCQLYKDRFLEFLFPLRGFAVAANEEDPPESTIPATELLYDYVGVIVQCDVPDSFPYIPTNILRPIPGIDDIKARDYVLNMFASKGRVDNIRLFPAKSPDKPAKPTEIVADQRAVRATSSPTKGPIWPSEQKYICVDQKAAWATPFEDYEDEITRQSGAFWDKADEKYGKDD